MRVYMNSAKPYIHRYAARELLRSRSIDPVYIAEDITIPKARKGIPQAALNRMGIVRENVAGNR